jgi:hypothetical protein
MSTYDKIAWLPLCGGVTGLGLVLSYLAMRRRGLRSGLRGAAWSLLPMAAYLTGAIEMFWKMGAAIGDFAKGFVFSDRVWSGIALAGLSVVLLVTSGGVRRRKVAAGARKQPVPAGAQDAGTPNSRALDSSLLNSGALGSGALAKRPQAAAVPAENQPATGRRGAGKAAADPDPGADDDMKDIEDILRRRGIK